MGILSIKRQGLLGTKTTEYPLSHIIDVIVHEYNSDEIPLVSLKLVSGELICVNTNGDAFCLDWWKKDEDRVAKLIREFLKLSSI